MKSVEGWKKDFFGRVAQFTMGQSPDSRYYSEEENELPFLQGCAEFEARFPKHNIHCSQTKKQAHKSSGRIEPFQLDKSGIKVVEYMTELPKHKLLERKLHKAVEMARKQLEASPTNGNTGDR